MATAKKCDCCDGLVDYLSTITLEVAVPVEAKGDSTSFSSWEVDICASCLSRSMVDVLSTACLDIVLPEPEGGR